MEWIRPKRKAAAFPSSPQDRHDEAIESDDVYGDFNAPLADPHGGTAVEDVVHSPCKADLLDVEESKRRLADPSDGTVSLDDLREELGL